MTAALIVALAIAPAWAQRADRYAPTNVEADRMEYDEPKQVNVFTGNVVLTRGTTTIRSDKMVLRQDPEGFQSGTATGRPATFRQKRDGVEQWVDGRAREIQYDGRNETVRLVGDARIRRTEGNRVLDEIEGGLIVYDTRAERFTVEGAAEAAAGGRVRLTIQPRLQEPGATPGAPAPAPLQPARRLSGPRAAEGR